MFKKGYEYLKRHTADREINNKQIRILRDDRFQNFKWKDIRVFKFFNLFYSKLKKKILQVRRYCLGS